MAPPLVLSSINGPAAGARANVSRPLLQNSASRPCRVTAQPQVVQHVPREVLLAGQDDRASPNEPEERVLASTVAPRSNLCDAEPACQPAPEYAATQEGNEPSSSCASYALCKDQNSVTIKSNTSVKDSAGAVMKVLDRLSSTIVTALQQEPGHEALNRAVKALAVCRKYLTDNHPGLELTFMPVHRSDSWGRLDPSMFSFLAFKSLLHPGAPVASGGVEECDLHVSSSSDVTALATAIVRVVVEHGQAVMKAGGSCALYVAMAAVVQARQHLKAMHTMDVALVPQWITEDTRATLGRESKFVQFLVLPAGLHGVMPGAEHAARQPAFTALCATTSQEHAMA